MKYFILFYEGALPIMFSNFECIFKINLFSLPNTNISPSITPACLQSYTQLSW